MPWPAKQRAAIAARMRREGKSREAVSRFFRAHGHEGGVAKRMKRKRK